MIVKKCLNCQKEFKTTHSTRKYCSDNCGSIYRYRGYKKISPISKICLKCGATYQSKFQLQKYCDNCRPKPKAKNVLFPRLCVQCGETFHTRFFNVRFCSVHCRDKFYRRNRSQSNKPCTVIKYLVSGEWISEKEAIKRGLDLEKWKD